jgi:hypothetical protein
LQTLWSPEWCTVQVNRLAFFAKVLGISRRAETLVASEGEGWLLPRFALPPWERILRELWSVTDETDQRWALARLVATPFAHFKQPLRRGNPHAASLPRRFIRCQGAISRGAGRCRAWGRARR